MKYHLSNLYTRRVLAFLTCTKSIERPILSLHSRTNVHLKNVSKASHALGNLVLIQQSEMKDGKLANSQA